MPVSATCALAVTAVIALGAAACADSPSSPVAGDGAAVAACRSSLRTVADPARLATTVRDEGDGYVVNAWTTGRAEGVPDHVCDVARDENAARGVAVVDIRPAPAR